MLTASRLAPTIEQNVRFLPLKLFLWLFISAWNSGSICRVLGQQVHLAGRVVDGGSELLCPGTVSCGPDYFLKRRRCWSSGIG